MAKIALKWLMLAVLTFELNAAAWPQNTDFGKSLFMTSCASCHGIDGKGNGPLSEQLKLVPPDLTVLVKKNGGVFPIRALSEVIDGRREVAAHGTRNMPVWGDLYAPVQSSYLKVTEQHINEQVVRGYILALIDYLNRIQEK
jgi:mono/diheme cytochrome c family protein